MGMIREAMYGQRKLYVSGRDIRIVAGAIYLEMLYHGKSVEATWLSRRLRIVINETLDALCLLSDAELVSRSADDGWVAVNNKTPLWDGADSHHQLSEGGSPNGPSVAKKNKPVADKPAGATPAQRRGIFPARKAHRGRTE